MFSAVLQYQIQLKLENFFAPTKYLDLCMRCLHLTIIHNLQNCIYLYACSFCLQKRLFLPQQALLHGFLKSLFEI